MSVSRAENHPQNEDAIEVVEDGGDGKGDGEAFTDVPLQDVQDSPGDGPKEKPVCGRTRTYFRFISTDIHL